MRVPDYQKRAAAAGKPFGVDEVMARFLNQTAESDFKPTFFEREIEPMLGIDVYSQPFPHDLGFQRYHSDPFDLLVLRSELSDVRKAEIIGEFTGLADLHIPRANQSADKAYAELRREFDARLTLTDALLDANYQTRFVQHFFSAQEIVSLRAKWKGGQG